MAGRMRTFPEIWPENMRRGESEIYFTAEPETGWWSINLDVFIMGEKRTQYPTTFQQRFNVEMWTFRKGQCDKSLNVTVLSGADWFPEENYALNGLQMK